MSMITKFYEEYVENKCGMTAESENLIALIASMVKKEDAAKIEDAITAEEDAACEAAFAAGFKTAFELFKEVLA